jgi:hypothetical protein
VVREAQTLRQQFSLSRGKLEGRLVVASPWATSVAQIPVLWIFRLPKARRYLHNMHVVVGAGRRERVARRDSPCSGSSGLGRNRLVSRFQFDAGIANVLEIAATSANFVPIPRFRRQQ